jgi:SAM-dependent methyltransferase
MSPEVHRTAAIGFQLAADAYRRGRPDYPPEAIEAIVGAAELGSGRRVVDLAAGTGALTRPLVASGARVVAVEPVEAMREILTRTVPEAQPCAALAEALPFVGGAFDAVTVAQAFHWFDAERARVEIHRVLSDRGVLALIWNVRDDRDPLQAALTSLMEPYRRTTPSHRGERWRAAFGDASGFEPLARSTFRLDQRLDVDRLVDRVSSVSFIAALGPDERARVERAVRSLTEGRKEVVLRYRTDVWITRRRRSRTAAGATASRAATAPGRPGPTRRRRGARS